MGTSILDREWFIAQAPEQHPIAAYADWRVAIGGQIIESHETLELIRFGDHR